MKKLLILLLFMFFATGAYAVDQRYMPDGYVRDDVIFPNYAKYTKDYFDKVTEKKIKCNWGTYRQEVNAPLRKVLEQLDKESRTEVIPRY
ncbi:MAG: hypothetical protein K6E29_00305 [Cyanobacteria bacterium RUI128]|nr:hypothetical protein [Cyanobacteria bacterium RUI128]